MGNYSYDQYLEQWDDHFGNALRGDFVYWRFGRRKIKTLPKMSEGQFAETLKGFDTLSSEIDILQKRHDYATNETIGQRVDALLGKCFECELPLFF